jgi:hypothetical protein
MKTLALPFSRALLIFATVCVGLAQTLPVTIKVSKELVPPGGMAQMKLLVTSPQPITSGSTTFGVPFSPDGIALFSSTGDVVGAAVVNGGQISLRFLSPNGTLGTDVGYPIATIAGSVSTNAIPGQQFPVTLDPASSWWLDLLGSSIPVELKSGTITVGGSVSITNVVPGGGTLPAGASFTIFGMGFTPQTAVTLSGIIASSIAYVSPTQIVVTLQDAATLDGTLIQIENPDKGSVTYYSYMRGVPVGQSADPLFAQTVPVFSISTATEAILPSTISAQINPAYVTGVAFQNSSQALATITVQSMSAAGQVTASTQLALAPGRRILRELSELFGSALSTGSYVHVLSTQPVQMLGLLGNHQTGVVLPLTFVSLSPLSSTAGALGL